MEFIDRRMENWTGRLTHLSPSVHRVRPLLLGPAKSAALRCSYLFQQLIDSVRVVLAVDRRTTRIDSDCRFQGPAVRPFRPNGMGRAFYRRTDFDDNRTRPFAHLGRPQSPSVFVHFVRPTIRLQFRFLRKLSDPFLEEEIDHTGGGYGQPAFGDGHRRTHFTHYL